MFSIIACFFVMYCLTSLFNVLRQVAVEATEKKHRRLQQSARTQDHNICWYYTWNDVIYFGTAATRQTFLTCHLFIAWQAAKIFVSTSFWILSHQLHFGQACFLCICSKTHGLQNSKKAKLTVFFQRNSPKNRKNSIFRDFQVTISGITNIEIDYSTSSNLWLNFEYLG